MKNFFLVIAFSLIFFCTSAQPASGGFAAPQFDVGISVLDLQKWVPNDEESLVISGKVKNFGVQPVSSFWVNYQIDGGEIFSYKVTGFLITQNNEQPFTHPDPVKRVLGNYTIKIWTSLPDEEEDENNKNDTLTRSYTIYNALTGRPRTIMLEGFSASTCGPCVNGNINLKAVLEENSGKYALIKYQMHFPPPGDAYYTAEIGARGSLYYVGSVPTIHVDGSTYKTVTHQLRNATLEELQNVPAFMEVDVDYYVEGKTVYAKAKIVPTEEMAGNMRLFMAIIEKKTYNNIGPNGETEFDQVVKKFMPNVNGIALDNIPVNTPFVALQNWEFKGNYRLPANAGSPINHEIEHSVEDFNNLTVVAWVQNMQNKEVCQAANGVATLGATVTFSSLPVVGATVTATLNGAPIASGAPVNSGELLVFSAEVHQGYEFVEWRYNGTIVDADNDNTVSITTDGNYADVTAVLKKTHTKVAEHALSNIILFPNPFTNSFTISGTENISKISITNIYGQLVQEKTLTGSSTTTVNTNELASGIYIISLWATNGEWEVRKMVKR